MSFRPEHRAKARVPPKDSARQPYVAEECCRAIFEHANDVLVLANLEARVIAINPRVESLLGYAPAEIVGRKFTELPIFLPERLHAVARLFEAAVKRGDVAASAGQKRSTAEVPLRHKDGHVVWVETATTAIKSGTGLMGFLSSLRDVSSMRKTRGQLIHALAWQEAIFDGSRDAVLITDRQLRFAAVNRAAVELTGYAREELLHMGVLDLYREQDLRVPRSVHARVMAGGEVTKEAPMKRKDGTIVDTETSIRRIMIGGKAYTHTTARDITKRKRAEESLRESEQKFRELFESAREAIVIFGLDKIITDANKFVEGYGFQRADLIGRNYLDFVAPPYREKAIEDFELLRAGVPLEGEFEVITPKGYVTVHYLDSPIVHGGAVVGVQSILTDITARKEAELQLLEYQRRLRALAVELTLAQERERRRIAVGVHDQIGQRLALIKLTLQSLCASGPENPATQTLEGVCGDIDRVLEDAHSLTFELSNPVLYEAGFADAVESWLARQVRGRYGIECTFEADDSVVELDKKACVALFYVVRELLTNVIRHAKAEHLDVRIQRTGDAMQIVVRDDGVGFEPSEAGKAVSASGGFGLFHVREQLDHLRGSLRIDSAPGKGTCVVAIVPFQSSQSPRRKGE